LDTKNTDTAALRNIYKALDAEFFRKAAMLANGFIKKFQYVECSRLTSRNFKDWNEFSEFRNCNSCDVLDEFLVNKTIEIIGLKE